MKLNKERGWEAKFCPVDGYAIEKCNLTKYITSCPVCQRDGRQTRLVDRFVVHVPENKILSPLAGGRSDESRD